MQITEGTRVHNSEWDYDGTVQRSLGRARWLVVTDQGVAVEADEHHLTPVSEERPA